MIPGDPPDFAIADDPQSTRPSIAKDLAYATADNMAAGSDDAFRVERGLPFLRAGKLVVATPQFKGLTIYSPNPNNQQVVTSVPTNSAKGTTSNPTTTSTTYVVIPEMKVSVTTSGGGVLVVFSGCIVSDNSGGNQRGDFAFFRDGVKISEFLNNFANANLGITLAFSFLDTAVPSGAHTYDTRWKSTTGVNTLTAFQTFRSLQALELQVGSSPSTAIAIPTKV